MAIAELVSPRSFAVRDYSRPKAAPGEVLVRVEAVGICGSDLHYFSEGHIGDVPAKYPMVLGHEPVGTIVECGDGVTGWSAGDRVALEPPSYCYHCEFCMTGRHNLCDHGRFMSSPDDPGFFRDHVSVPAINLLPLPKNLGFAEGTLWEPVSIILHSFRFARPQIGETVAVIGAGPIGLTTIAALKIAGAARVFCIEPLAHRRTLALELGADEAIDSSAVDPVHEVLQATHRRGVDLAIDCATRDNTINQCIRMARSAGRVLVTGVPTDVNISLEFHPLRRKELEFFTVRRSNHVGQPSLRLLEEHPKRFTPMITHRAMLGAIQSSFETLESYADGVGKIVLYPE
jgi:L-iditol 2-dehydrogenase